MVLLVLLLVVFFSVKNTRTLQGGSFGNVIQELMSLNLGFSSIENLVDTGISDFHNHKELNVLLSSAPRILTYNLYNRDSVKFERLDIKISFNNFLELNNDRKKAINIGILDSPTEFNVKLNSYGAKLRLKGDNSSHWYNAPRFSFRVKIKDNKTLFGFSKFSIQKPRERRYPYDHTFQSLMQDVGNLSTINKYIHLYVNGQDWGIMHIEEHVSSELLEKQTKKISVLVRFASEKKWLYVKKTPIKDQYSRYKISDPTLITHFFDKKKLINKSGFREVYSYIVKHRMKKNHTYLYDIDSFSKAYIMAVIWGEDHTLNDSNSRYYFNPYTLKLEVITTDQGFWSRIDENFHSFEIPGQYLDVLQTKTYSKNLDKNLQKLKNVVLNNMENYLDYLRRLFPLDKRKAPQVVISNIEKIISNKERYLLTLPAEYNFDIGDISSKDFVLPSKQQASKFTEHLHVRHYTDGTMKFYNLIPDNVIVKDILFNGKSFIDKEISIPSYFSSTKPITINTPYRGIHDNMFVVNTEYQGFNSSIESGLTLVSNDIGNPLLLNTAHEFDFINKLDDKMYEIKSGNWTVKKPIIIEGDLHIPSGVNLQFLKDSYLIVKGALTAIGDEDNPITLRAKSSLWKGVYVLNADKKSYLKNVNISNLLALKDGILNLTGGLTFYKSDVDFENVKINNIKAEDAINIVKSKFSLNSVYINTAVSDGLDSDFSKGSILNSEFSDIGGDALDFSGSNVSINLTKARNIKDKAVSAGEKSTISIKNSNFDNIGIGIASKDGSSVTVLNTQILNYKLYGAMSYLKKDFYDMPNLTINNSIVSNGRAYIRQKGANMTVDGINMPEVKINVKKLYKRPLHKSTQIIPIITPNPVK